MTGWQVVVLSVGLAVAFAVAVAVTNYVYSIGGYCEYTTGWHSVTWSKPPLCGVSK